MRKIIIITGVGVLLFLSVWVLIKKTSQQGEYVKFSYNDLPNWSTDHQSLAFAAFKKSCTVFLSQPAIKKIFPQRLGGTSGDWQLPCGLAKKIDDPTDQDARKFFENNFTLLSYSTDTEGLFTGYFAPEYNGSAQPSEKYNYPLYGVPENLKVLDLGKFSTALKGKTIIGQVQDDEFIPYSDRKDIDTGVLNNKQLELVWLADPTDAFFMHIQGSGVIRYQNGDRKIFGYAGKNGKAYHSVGKFLIRSGDITRENMSMQAIRAWILANPSKAMALMWKNPSYIFFRPLDKAAPVGAMNVELTAGRSLAVDREYVPFGMPVWLDLKSAAEEDDPVRRLVIAQDTGGAIKGRVRADVYWGMGEDAGLMAGPMKERGRFYFLLPNALAQRILSEKEALP